MGAPLIIRSRDLVRVPWKDGGGTTAEVAIFPAGAGFDEFDWRISLADVAAEGPFSRFTGVDRTLVLVEGRDLVLEVDGTPHQLAVRGSALRFEGEAHVVSRLGSGPIRDLNIMTRRAKFVQEVRSVAAGGGPHTMISAAVAVVMALGEDVVIALDDATVTLGRLDALVLDGDPMTGSVTGEAVMVGLMALQA